MLVRLPVDLPTACRGADLGGGLGVGGVDFGVAADGAGLAAACRRVDPERRLGGVQRPSPSLGACLAILIP